MSWSLLKLRSVELVVLFSQLIFCCLLLLLPSIFPSIRVFSNEWALSIRWSKYWRVSISPSNEYSGLVSFRVGWFDLLAVHRTLMSLLQHHNSKALVAPKQQVVVVLVYSLKSCLTLCDPVDCSPPGSSVHGISQSRILQWVATSFCRVSFRPRDWICISCIAGGFFTAEPPGKPKRQVLNIKRFLISCLWHVPSASWWEGVCTRLIHASIIMVIAHYFHLHF